MRVLAMDTSSSLASIAALIEGQLVAEVSASAQARFGETILPYVDQVLNIAALDRCDLDLVAVGIGPGSFTGTRIGVATAKGLALALGVPVVGVPTSRAIASALTVQNGIAVPVIDAFKGEVYYAAYQRHTNGELSERISPHHGTASAAALALRTQLADEPLILCGNGLRRYESDILKGLGKPYVVSALTYDVPRASSIAHEAVLAYQQRGADNLSELEPLYVRSSDAKLPAVPHHVISR